MVELGETPVNESNLGRVSQLDDNSEGVTINAVSLPCAVRDQT